MESGLQPPNPLPRVRGRGLFYKQRRRFVAAAPFRRPALLRVGLPQLLPPGRRPLALSCAVVVRRSCTVVPTAYVTSPEAHLPAKRAESGHVAALSRPVACGALSSFGCVRRCQPTTTARVSKQGEPLAVLPLVQIDVQAPTRQSRGVIRPVSYPRVPIFRLPRT